MTISVTFDSNISDSTKQTVNSLVNLINSDPQFTRTVSVFVTGTLPPSQATKLPFNYQSGVANFTFSNEGKNNNIWVNNSFDYGPVATTQQLSLMHELTHVEFPGSAGSTISHNEPFYENLAKISESIGIAMANSDYEKWATLNPSASSQYLTDIATSLQNHGISKDQIGQILLNYGQHCFAAGTLISLKDGSLLPIEEIGVGQEVLAYNPTEKLGRGRLCPQKVTRTFRSSTDEWIVLKGNLRVTPGHLFLTEGGQFDRLDAILTAGKKIVEASGHIVTPSVDKIFTRNGRLASIAAGSFAVVDNETCDWTTYNLEVSELHNLHSRRY